MQTDSHIVAARASGRVRFGVGRPLREITLTPTTDGSITDRTGPAMTSNVTLFVRSSSVNTDEASPRWNVMLYFLVRSCKTFCNKYTALLNKYSVRAYTTPDSASFALWRTTAADNWENDTRASWVWFKWLKTTFLPLFDTMQRKVLPRIARCLSYRLSVAPQRWCFTTVHIELLSVVTLHVTRKPIT